MAMTADEHKADAARAKLDGYIANSRRVQRRMRTMLAIVVPVALVTWFFHATVGVTVFLIGLLVAATGYYITGMHILDWQAQLYDLDAEE